MPSFEGNSCTQGHEVLSPKTRVLGAAYSEDFVILGVAVLIQCQDGLTDRWTDAQTTAKTCDAFCYRA